MNCVYLIFPREPWVCLSNWNGTRSCPEKNIFFSFPIYRHLIIILNKNSFFCIYLKHGTKFLNYTISKSTEIFIFYLFPLGLLTFKLCKVNKTLQFSIDYFQYVYCLAIREIETFHYSLPLIYLSRI